MSDDIRRDGENRPGPAAAPCPEVPDARLSAWLDGDLEPGEARALERHLEGCNTCRHLADDLRRVKAWAGDLPERGPERDLWPAIRSGLAGAVVELPGTAGEDRSTGAPGRGPRRISLTVGQLVAAAASLVLVAGGAVWTAARVAVEPGSSPVATGPAAPAPDGSPAAVPLGRLDGPAPSPPPGEVAAEISELQAVLAGSRDRLAPQTVETLERNLALIDRAIRESAEALARDPSNAFVEDYLHQAYRRKADYLREAASLLELTD